MPVAKIRAKIRQQFERHRYVNQLPAVDVLITQSHMEFQVRCQDSLNWGFFLFVGFYQHPDTAHAGDAELLEAIGTRDEVFPSRGGLEGEVTEKFHFGLPRGKLSWLPLPFRALFPVLTPR